MYPLHALSSLLPSGFTSDFRFYDYYYISCLLYHSNSILPVSCSYLIIPCVFPAWYHLLYIYLLLHACTHNTIFYACLWFEFIDTRVHLSTPFGISVTTRWGVLTPLDPRVLLLELGALPVADQRGTTVAWIIGRPSRAHSSRPPCASLEFSFRKLVSFICTVYTCTSLCILAIVPIGDVIFL